MEKFNEKVATENATTIMTERMLDLLTNHTRITDYVARADIEITIDFTYGWVDVKTDRFTITYLINSTPRIKFEEDFEYNTIDLSDLIDMLNYNEEVDNIFHTIKNEMFN